MKMSFPDFEHSKKVEMPEKQNEGMDWRDAYIARQQKAFALEHKDLMRQYAADLPAVEKGTRVITVVPVYRELQNNNFWRLLASATENQHKAQVCSEVLYIVNNAPDDAIKQTAAYQENQQTLACLKLLQETIQCLHETGECGNALQKLSEIVPDVTANEKQIFQKAIEAGTKMFGVDASGEQWAIPKEYNARGRARNIGTHIAYERLRTANEGTKTEGILDFIDADCWFPRGYISKLAKAGTEHTLLIKSLIAQTPDISEYVDREPDPIKKLIGLIQYVRYALLQGRVHYLLNIDDQGQPLEHTGHGPGMAVRVNVIREIGGYPQRHWSEDFVLHGLLTHVVPSTDIAKTDVRLQLSHRSREDAADGFQLAALDLQNGVDPLAYLKQLTHPVGAESDAGSANAVTSRMRIFVEEMLQRDAELAEDPAYQRVRLREFRHERLQRTQFLKMAKDIIRSVVRRSLEPSMEKDRSTYESEYQRLVADVPEQYQDLLLANPSMIEAMMTVYLVVDDPVLAHQLGLKRDGDDAERVIHFFEQYVPEYFAAPPKEEPDYDKLRTEIAATGWMAYHNARDIIHIAKAVHDVGESRH